MVSPRCATPCLSSSLAAWESAWCVECSGRAPTAAPASPPAPPAFWDSLPQGYGGIKVALPVELTTNRCYLELYIRHILAFQARAGDGVKVRAAASHATRRDAAPGWAAGG